MEPKKPIPVSELSMERKKVIYITGPFHAREYYKPFEQAEEDLDGLGYTPLSPARLPEGMTEAQYTKIHLAMIDGADAVLLLPGAETGDQARLEYEYCKYTRKPVVFLRDFEECRYEKLPREIVQAWLKHDLEEVFKQ